MRTDEGTYALCLQCEEETTVEVGALGFLTIQPGLYVYVGSAFGPGGLRARVGRHARDEGALHWHVDYLRVVTTLEAVWYTHDPTRRECVWAAVLGDHPAARVPMTGFGASDCDCPTHLFRFEEAPSLATFRQRVRACCPDHETIARIDPHALRA